MDSMPKRPGAFCVLVVAIFSSGTSHSPAADREPPPSLAPFFRPPAQYEKDFGPYQSPLKFNDGHIVANAEDWAARRREIIAAWHAEMGPWPPRIEHPQFLELCSEKRENFTQKKVKVEVAPDRITDGYLLIPEGPGPFPAVLVVYYEPETAIGLGKQGPQRDFALRAVRRGYATLSIGFDPRVVDPEKLGGKLQVLSYLAYVASNAYTAITSRNDVDPKRVAVMGHSYGGKWAMFAACLDDRFACGVWSDPGVAFDETRPNVNYWDPWYLGWEPTRKRSLGLPTKENPSIGPYAQLVAQGHDLHELQALMAPRPFLVSGGSEDGPERWHALNHVVAVNALLGHENRVAMTHREGHTPTEESNTQIDQFLDYVLKSPR